MILSPTDVSIAMRRSLDGAEAEFLSILLPMMQESAEGFMGRALELAEREEIGLPLFPAIDFVVLHYTPVRSVSEVKIDGNVWALGSYSFERSGLRLVGPGQPLFSAGVTPSRLDVKYIGGLGPPATTRAREVLLLRTVRLMAKFRDDTIGADSVRAESYAAQYLSEGWTDDEEKRLRRIGGKVAVSSRQSPAPPAEALESWGFS